MKFNAITGKRNFTTQPHDPGLKLNPTRLTWTAIGGPDRATIKATGNEYSVWEMVDRLRCPVDIYTDLGEHVWWGFVESVQLQYGALTIGVSLEKMANRVKCVYSEVNISGTVGERNETAWQEDTDSSTEFGAKETTVQLAQGSAEEAEQRALTALEMWKYPLVTRAVNPNRVNAIEATIQCRGWWSTLDWVLYSNADGSEAYEDSGEGEQDMGDASARTAIAQSFQVASTPDWEVSHVRIRMKRIGNPTDDFYVNICSDSGGAPGSVLTNGSLNGTAISDNTEWHEFEMGSKISLTGSTTYWLKMERIASPSGTDYFQVDVNEALGYSGGVFRIYNGATWAARSPDADMLFTVSGVIETSQQIEDIITETEQFFEGIDRDVDSGVFSNPWRDGDQTALTHVMELLEAGTDNNRRILARVERDRRLSVFEEPAPGDNDFILDVKGDLYDPYNKLVRRHEWQVGVWANLKDVIPSSVDVFRLTNPNRVFLEEVIYDVERDQTTIRERDTNQLLELL